MAMKKKSVPERGSPPPCAETPPAPPAIGESELADILDAPAIQSMMDAFFALEKIGMAIVDLRGRVLVATGWQDICTKFHRAHPEACKHCVESDVALSAGIAPGEFKLYRCQNNLWDMATPIVVGGRHIGNLFLGQFFFDDEQPDAEIFRAQARQFGFNEPEYLAALDRVPRWSREKIDRAMAFYAALARQISALGYRNLQLTRALADQRRTEKALQESEEQYRLLVGNAQEAVYVVRDGKVMFANAMFARLADMDASDVIGTSTEEFVAPDDRAGIRDHHRRLVAGEPVEGPFEIRMRTRKGAERWVSINAARILWQGQPATLNFAADITDRKRTEERLRLHAQLLDGVRESVVASDLEGRILYWGRGAEKLYGYTAEEVLGQPYRNFAGAIEPPDEEAFRKAILAKGAWKGEHLQKNRGGETFWTSTFISLVTDEQGRPAGYIGIDQDITDRKQAERTLRESDERFRQVAETAEEWIWEMDAAGVYTYSNPVVEQILGYKPEELVGKIHFHELFAPQVREEIRKDAAERAVRKEAFRKRVNPVVRKDGRIVILETTGVPILDPEGHLAGYRGTDTDVTRRMRAEEALRKSEAQLSNALEMAHAGHWEYDVASDTFTFNDNFYRIFRTTAEQMGGYRMAAAEYARRFCHPDDMAIVDEETRKALESADPGYNRQFEHRILYADGTTGHIAVRFFIVKDAQGRTVKTYGVNQDVTERKQVEEALQESEALYRSILNASPDNITIADLEGRILMTSPSALAMLRCKRDDQLVGRPVFDFIVPEDRERAAADLVRMFQDAAPTTDEYRALRADGSRFDVEVNGEFIRGSDGLPLQLLLVIRDVTDRKRIAEKLRDSEARYRTFIDASSDLVFLKDEAFRYIISNRANCAFLGKPEEDVIGRTDFDFMPQEAAARCRDSDQEALRQGKSVAAEEAVDGKFFQAVKFPVALPDGRTGVGGYIRDITRQKKTDEEIRQLSKFPSENPNPVLRVDRTGRILFANEAGTPILNAWKRTTGEIVPAGWLEKFTGTFASGQNAEVEINCAGHVFSCILTPVPGEDYANLYGRDITARKQAEEAMRQSEEKFAQAFQISPYAITLTRAADGRFIEINDAFTAITGFTREEALADSSIGLGLWARPADRQRVIDDLCQGVPVIGREYAFRAKSGHLITGLFSAQILRLGDESCILSSINDISDRKQAEEALRDSEQRHRDYLAHSPYGIFVADEKGRLVQVNPAACRITGYPEKELLALTVPDLHGEDGRKDAARHFQTVVREGKAIGELKYRTKSGEPRWWLVSAVKISDTRFLGFCNDITDRKQAEEKLQASTERFRDIAANIPGAIYQLQTGRTGSLEVSYMSSGCEALFERPLAGLDFTGLLFDQMHVGDRALFQHSLAKATKQMERWSLEFRVTTAEGKNKWLRASANPRQTPQGAILWNGVLLDITELKLAEESLREREAFQTLLMDTIPSPVFYKDRQGRYLGFNKAFETLYGKTKEQLVGKSVFDIAPPELAKIYHAKDLELLEQPGTQVYEAAMQDAQGVRHDVIFHKASIIDAHGSVAGLIGILLDVTERKRTEENILQESLLNHAIIDSIPGTFYMLDESGNYMRWSKYQQEQIVGQPDERMRQTNALATIHPDDRDRVRARIENVLRNGVDEVVEGRVLLRGGPGFRWLLMTGRQMVVEGRPALIGIGIDITERKEAEEQVARQLDELRRWQTVTLGREGRVAELKREVNALAGRLGQPPPYPSAETP